MIARLVEVFLDLVAERIAKKLMPAPRKLLYSREEAAASLGISKGKLDQLRNDGFIRGYQPPGMSDLRYQERELLRWAGYDDGDEFEAAA